MTFLGKAPTIAVEVVGTPGTKGSARGFIGRGRAAGRVIITNDNPKAKSWQGQVAAALLLARQRAGLFGTWAKVPVALTMTFYLARPKTHYHTSKKRKGQLREDAPEWHTTRPDFDKLARSTADALTKVVVDDDCQIASATVRKRYVHHLFLGGQPGVVLSVEILPDKPRR